MVDYVPSEKGTPIRNPSTANLAINSRDRVKAVVPITYTNTITGQTGADGANGITCQGSFSFLLGQVVTISGLTGAGAVLNGKTGAISSVTGTGSVIIITTTTAVPVVSFGSYGGVITGTVSSSYPQSYAQPSTNFTISNKNNILTGFFTRMAVNEVVLFWGRPNILLDTNDRFSILVGSTIYTAILTTGNYTVKEALDAIVTGLNTATATAQYSITSSVPGSVQLSRSTGQFAILSTPLSLQLNFSTSTSGLPFNFSAGFVCYSPFLLNDSYIDITSNSLTYCQDLKDGSTSLNSRDILYRWNFGWDEDPLYDAYGYPILQGYKEFNARRSIPFPKQIKWDNIQPIGQINLQIYDSEGSILYQPVIAPNDPGSLNYGQIEYSLNLLVSEV